MKGKNCLSWLMLRWKMCLWVLAVLCSLAIFGLLCRGDQRVVNTLFTQIAAERWETEEKPYSLSSVFLTEQEGIPATALTEIRIQVENALTAAGVPSENYPWLYACSRTQDAVLKNGNASAEVEVTLVSGDYFTIHPLPVRKGWYFDDSEVMRDRIVLDRQTAWKLFYSDNVAGQYLQWDGHEYVVAAVVDMEPGKFNEKAAGDTCRAWALGDSPAAGEDGKYTCVEMVLPQPVDGFGASTLKTVLTGYGDVTVLDNSNRFSLKNRWNALRHISTRWVSTDGVGYPYYECAAQLVENHLALRLIPEGILLGFVAVSGLIWLILWNRRRTWGLHNIRDAIIRRVEQKRTRDYEARIHGEPVTRGGKNGSSFKNKIKWDTFRPHGIKGKRR